MFSYEVKTIKSHDYFSVIARGTKKDMTKFAEVFDAHPETLESRIIRKKDGKFVHEFKR